MLNIVKYRKEIDDYITPEKDLGGIDCKIATLCRIRNCEDYECDVCMRESLRRLFSEYEPPMFENGDGLNMQEPIISPWLIYLANVPQTLTFALVITVFTCVVIAVAAVFFRYMAKDEAKTLKDMAKDEAKTLKNRAYRYAYQGAEKEMMEEAHKREADAKKLERITIVASIIAVISLSICAFMPSKETCYQMIAAHYMTYENVDAVGGQAKEVVDYIFDKVDEVTNDEQ